MSNCNVNIIRRNESKRLLSSEEFRVVSLFLVQKPHFFLIFIQCKLMAYSMEKQDYLQEH